MCRPFKCVLDIEQQWLEEVLDSHDDELFEKIGFEYDFESKIARGNDRCYEQLGTI